MNLMLFGSSVYQMNVFGGSTVTLRVVANKFSVHDSPVPATPLGHNFAVSPAPEIFAFLKITTQNCYKNHD